MGRILVTEGTEIVGGQFSDMLPVTVVDNTGTPSVSIPWNKKTATFGTISLVPGM